MSPHELVFIDRPAVVGELIETIEHQSRGAQGLPTQGVQHNPTELDAILRLIIRPPTRDRNEPTAIDHGVVLMLRHLFGGGDEGTRAGDGESDIHTDLFHGLPL